MSFFFPKVGNTTPRERWNGGGRAIVALGVIGSGGAVTMFV